MQFSLKCALITFTACNSGNIENMACPNIEFSRSKQPLKFARMLKMYEVRFFKTHA